MNKNIQILEAEKKVHTKASESYLSVRFSYPNGVHRDVWIPIVYRRTGLDLDTDAKIFSYLDSIYDYLNPSNYDSWRKQETKHWDDELSGKDVTRPFFDALIDFEWHCVNCSLPPNPNWARRTQDIKEFGYTLATNTKKYCPHCEKNTTHLMMIPVPRGSAQGNGYESWSPALRKRIIKLLGSIDVYENRFLASCLPDHKFSEIRWDEETKSENPDTMTDDEIRAKFQLLSNQRNEQKREVCRNCFQTGQRGIAFGIPFFYEGGPKWDETIPKKGKDAERGCVGCVWYDIALWRIKLLEKIR